ncbi:NUDIX hydrolase [Flocculibacter collagenilyticus]|uniref:NUDIX hydrolase n=1 Tax=Flocculibacter collagenilyticus TaxID=2744479 RepID=UPI0018F3D4CE|nr:NUDIX hydrolase [Flocculibacter collagenilyticus]
MFKPNATVAAIVKFEDKYLLVEEKDKQTGDIVFNQPAGHLEHNESLLDAVSRELKEETGYLLQPDYLLGVYQYTAPSNNTTYLRFCFIFEPAFKPSGFGPSDSDIINTHWLTYSELSAKPLRSPLVVKCIDDYLAGQKLPLTAIHRFN